MKRKEGEYWIKVNGSWTAGHYAINPGTKTEYWKVFGRSENITEVEEVDETKIPFSDGKFFSVKDNMYYQLDLDTKNEYLISFIKNQAVVKHSNLVKRDFRESAIEFKSKTLRENLSQTGVELPSEVGELMTVALKQNKD